MVDRSKMRRSEVPLPANVAKPAPPRRQSSRGGPGAAAAAITDPNVNPDIVDGVNALRASPDGHEDAGPNPRLKRNGVKASPDATTEDKVLSSAGVNGQLAPSGEDNGVATVSAQGKPKRKKIGAPHVKVEEEESNIGAVQGVAKHVINPARANGSYGDPDAGEGLEAGDEDEVEVKEAMSRPPPVNSDYLPLPWKGRLGYVCTQHTITGPSLTITALRPVSTPIYATPNPPCLALEPVVSRASSSTAIP